MVAILIRAHAGDLLKRPRKVPGIAIPYALANVADLELRVGQQLLRPFNANLVEQVVKTLLQMAVEELTQVPLGHIAVIGNVLQRDLIRKALLHKLHRLAHEKAACGLRFLHGFFLREPRRAEVFGHRAHGLVDLVHLGGLEEQARDPKADRILRIGKVAIAGQAP